MYKDAPDEAFQQHTFEEIMEWKVAGWELPSDIACIIRATNLKTQRTKEYVYKRQHAAEQKVLDLMDAKTHEFTVCTHDSIHYVGPNPPTDD
jgi:HD-like signal output (HDOD) protein